jgi:hypothetical protein
METKQEGLDLRQFKFPEVTAADMAFPTANTNPVLLEEAKRRGYLYGHKSGNKMFTTLFYKGGALQIRKDIPEDFLRAVNGYFRSLIGSWAPKHEHKEAVCAMLLDEIASGVEEAPKKAAA